MRFLRIVVAIVVVLALAAGIFVWRSQWPVIAGIEPPPASAFAAGDIAAGARLAAIGNCRFCHTAAGGADYAGNRAIPTPFGSVSSSNITPAPGSGIGRWSEAAFRRAMRQGISRKGAHLYPAFPYDHFARLGDTDLHALYAFLMTRRPVEISPKPNALPFPLGQRWLMAFWNLLFFDAEPFRPDPRQSPEWNRGAYLVAGLGHCGDCHTPRNLLGAENRGRALAGGEAEGWTAPALNGDSPAPVPWDAAQLFAYLRHGQDAEHGAAAGPMQPVVRDLAQADEGDVRAIAAYIAAQQGDLSDARRQRADKARAMAASRQPPEPGNGEALGAALFAGACARCHIGPALLPPHGIPLSLGSTVSETRPRNALHIVLDGIRPREGHAGPWMPGFAAAFTDAQIAALLGYVRAHYGSGPAWSDLEKKARDIRNEKGGS